MALKHWGGTIPAQRAAWTCPTCGAKNVNALEDGCPTCKAGADAKKADTLPPVERDAPEAALKAARLYAMEKPVPEEIQAMLVGAFLMGTEWQRQAAWAAAQRTGTHPTHPAVGPVTPQGGWVLAMVSPDTKEPSLTDQRTHDTIVAALGFYRDNQLGYGPVPGQLSAEEVTQLISQLSPQEQEQEK